MKNIRWCLEEMTSKGKGKQNRVTKDYRNDGMNKDHTKRYF